MKHSYVYQSMQCHIPDHNDPPKNNISFTVYDLAAYFVTIVHPTNVLFVLC
jgi:hypothetical protein